MNKIAKRLLTVILAAACVITALPDTAYEVYAGEIDIMADDVMTEEEIVTEEEASLEEETAEVSVTEEDAETEISDEDENAEIEDSMELQAVDSKCGETMYYRLSNNGKTLTIYGSGRCTMALHGRLIYRLLQKLFFMMGLHTLEEMRLETLRMQVQFRFQIV